MTWPPGRALPEGHGGAAPADSASRRGASRGSHRTGSPSPSRNLLEMGRLGSGPSAPPKSAAVPLMLLNKEPAGHLALLCGCAAGGSGREAPLLPGRTPSRQCTGLPQGWEMGMREPRTHACKAWSHMPPEASHGPQG